MNPDPHRCRSHLLQHCLAAALLVLLQAGRAAADVLPPDACSVEGADCQLQGAPPSSNGLCTRSRCTRYYPVYPDAGAGAGGSGAPIYKPYEVDCLRCILGSPADAGTAGAGDSDAGTAGNGDDEGCGCGLPGTEGEGPLAAILLGLGVLALRAGRRRR
jgi:hypothetical protein